jgi:transposase
LSSSYGSVTVERAALVEQNERLRHLLLKLQRRQFGRKSERLTDEQLQFAFEEIEATLAETAAEAGQRSPAAREQQKQRRRAGRGYLPAHLPEIEQVLAPEATTCPCCQGPLVEIGVDTARRLDVIPAQFRVLVTKRPKLACSATSPISSPAWSTAGPMTTSTSSCHGTGPTPRSRQPQPRAPRACSRRLPSTTG